MERTCIHQCVSIYLGVFSVYLTKCDQNTCAIHTNFILEYTIAQCSPGRRRKYVQNIPAIQVKYVKNTTRLCVFFEASPEYREIHVQYNKLYTRIYRHTMQGVFILYVFMQEVLNTYRIYNKYTLQYTLEICIPISPREYNAGCIYFVCILYVFMEGVLNTYKIYPRHKVCFRNTYIQRSIQRIYHNI